MEIWCCECKSNVGAVLTSGEEIYPHRSDLFHVPFWKCEKCKNYVGCHYKTNDKTRPLGVIPSKEIKNARSHIHKLIDPIWKNGLIKRGVLYSIISNEVGYEYHTGEIRTIEEARNIYRIVLEIKKRLSGSTITPT